MLTLLPLGDWFVLVLELVCFSHLFKDFLLDSCQNIYYGSHSFKSAQVYSEKYLRIYIKFHLLIFVNMQ